MCCHEYVAPGSKIRFSGLHTKRTNNIYIFMCQITLNLAFIGLLRFTVRMHNKKRQQIADKTGERDRKLAKQDALSLSLSLFLSICVSVCWLEEWTRLLFNVQ